VTRFVGSCLKTLEGCPSPVEGRLALQKLALEPVALPGERGFPLEGIFEAPETRGAADLLRAWLAQARAEAGLRLLTLFYTPAGRQSAFWLEVARRSRKFFVVFETYRQPVEEEAAYKRNQTSSRSIEYKMPAL
jgi:actin related protein 2/3 complex subunit 3